MSRGFWIFCKFFVKKYFAAPNFTWNAGLPSGEGTGLGRMQSVKRKKVPGFRKPKPGFMINFPDQKPSASGGARTRTPRGHKILSLGCLPVPTHSPATLIIDHEARESQDKNSFVQHFSRYRRASFRLRQGMQRLLISFFSQGKQMVHPRMFKPVSASRPHRRQ